MRNRSRFALLGPGALLPTEKRGRSNPKVTIAETDLQQMAESLCIALGIRFFRIPDALLAFLARSAPAWTRIFVSRYLAGVPDLMLFRALPGGKNEVCFLELKTEAGKVSQGQRKWHSGLNVIICHGWNEIERAIMDFKNQERDKP